MDQRNYTPEEAEAILLEANRVDPDLAMSGGPVTSEQLRAMGAEAGLTPEQIRAAEDAYMRKALEKAQTGGESQFAQFVAEQKSRIKAKVASFLGTATMLFGINLVTSPGFWWSMYPIGIMGVVLASDLIKRSAERPTPNSQQYQKWLRKQNRSNQDLYVRNREAETHLDSYYKANRKTSKLDAVRALVDEFGFENDEAVIAVDDYWRRRAW